MALEKPWFDAWLDDGGDGVSGTIWNKTELAKMIDGLDASKHFCAVSRAANFALGVGFTQVQWDTLEADRPLGSWVAPSTIRIPAGGGGLYCVIATAIFQAGGGGADRQLQVNLSGTLLMRVLGGPAPVGSGYTMNAIRFIDLVQGHEIVAHAYSDVATVLMPQSRLSVVRI